MRQNNGFLINAGPSMIILAILREGPTYGVDIARELEQRTDAHLSFKPGTLYPMLHQLQKAGHICSQWMQPENERARRVYELTDKGRAEIERLIEVWQEYTRAVGRVIDPSPSQLSRAY